MCGDIRIGFQGVIPPTPSGILQKQILESSVQHFRDSIESTSFVDLQWALGIIRTFLRATSHTRLRARDRSLHFKHSHWWKRRSRTKFASHHTWGANGVYKWMQDGIKVFLHGFLHGIEWIMFYGHLDYFQAPLLGGRSNTKSEDYGTLNAHNRWFILFYHVWGPTWIKIHWNSIWLRARSHMASHLHLRVRDHTTWCWTCVGMAFGHFSFGLPQHHGHNSWLMCEVALKGGVLMVVWGQTAKNVATKTFVCQVYLFKGRQVLESLTPSNSYTNYEILCHYHNIIQIHNMVMWDIQYFTKCSLNSY